ncbi:hypothetical protein JST97_27520 [bacterium]|nr:hypothetical protein [bacterium]
MQIRTQQPIISTPAPRGVQAKTTGQGPQAPNDSVEISTPGPVKLAMLKGLKASAGAVGALVGGTLGLVPGIALGLSRTVYTPDRTTDHLTVCETGDMWGLSYGVLGAGMAVLAASVLQTHPIQNVAMLAAAVPLAMAPQAIFREIVRHDARTASSDTYFTSTLTYCADAHMSSQTSGLFSGMKAGIVHGARQGKLAFQDLLVPSLKPSEKTYYGAPQQ